MGVLCGGRHMPWVAHGRRGKRRGSPLCRQGVPHGERQVRAWSTTWRRSPCRFRDARLNGNARISSSRMPRQSGRCRSATMEKGRPEKAGSTGKAYDPYGSGAVPHTLQTGKRTDEAAYPTRSSGNWGRCIGHAHLNSIMERYWAWRRDPNQKA